MIVIKLGGSVITDKSKECRVKRRIIERLLDEIKRSEKKTIIVHGAGSFGHISAKKYGLNEGFKNIDQLEGFHLTHYNVRKLNQIIMEYLYIKKMFSISIPPLYFLTMKGGNLEEYELDIFDRSISFGLTPVTFGDVVFDVEKGFSICSGDLIVQILSEHFIPDKVIFVIDEDGLFDKDPKKYGDAKFVKEIRGDEIKASFDKPYIDVTDGMEGKIGIIKDIARKGIDVFIINGNKRGRLYRCLIGKKVKGTHIIGG